MPASSHSFLRYPAQKLEAQPAPGTEGVIGSENRRLLPAGRKKQSVHQWGLTDTLYAICAIFYAKLRSSTILNGAVERVEPGSAISLNRFHAVDESLIANVER